MNSSNKITLTCIKELTYHNEPVYNLLLLHDGRLASCSDDHTIKVVSLKPYHCDISTKAHSARVTYISQMGNGALLSCSEDKTVKLWSIGKSHLAQKKEMKPHNTCIYKVIQIKENIIATCSADLSVKVSDIDKCKEIYTFPKTQQYVKNIYYIKKRKLLVIPDYQLLRLYDIDSYEEKVKIPFYGIINYMNSIYEINDTFLVFGDYNIEDKDNLLYIYNMDTNQIELTIVDTTMFSNKEWYGVFSFITMSNILVCGCPSGGILALDPTLMITLHRESAHSESVSAVVKINELTFASTSKKGVIKLWRIKSN